MRAGEEMEKQAGVPTGVLDPGTPGSRPEPNAEAQPLSRQAPDAGLPGARESRGSARTAAAGPAVATASFPPSPGSPRSTQLPGALVCALPGSRGHLYQAPKSGLKTPGTAAPTPTRTHAGSPPQDPAPSAPTVFPAEPHTPRSRPGARSEATGVPSPSPSLQEHRSNPIQLLQ